MKRCNGCFEEYEDGLDLCPHCGHEDGESAEEALHLEPGTVLKDTYIVGKVLGYGGFGVTYLGWNTVLEQKVAIKEYLPSEFSTRMQGQTKVTVFNGDKSEQFRDGVEKFVDEANRLAQFRNTDGIVRIFESFHENNTAYIAMEYLDGETLTKYLEKTGQLNADEALRLMTPIIQSLQIVHEHGIIHRDIAPDNIIITKSGEVKLIDFGAARYATTSHSRSLTVVIKPGYSPEEQYRSRGDQGAWTDVYAVGATMYRMITGQTPPDAMERRAFFEGKKKDILAPLTKYSKQIYVNRETAILNAMNVRIEDRTPDMKTFEQELTSEEEVKRRYGKIKKIDILKWPLWAKIAVPIAACAVVTIGVLFTIGIINFIINPPKDYIVPTGCTVVPSVINMKADEAINLLEIERKLTVIIKASEYSELIAEGLVLTQDLNPGDLVQENDKVTIKVSGGKMKSDDELAQKDENGQVSLAKVMEKSKEEATRILNVQEMKIVLIEQSDEMYEAGVVIGQVPSAGTLLIPGAEVTITVSTGPAAFNMPDVAGKTEADAKTELNGKGLAVAVKYDNDDGVPTGSVITQDRLAGSKVNRGDTVTITVCSGKELFQVANVIGKTESDAMDTLRGQDFKPVPSGEVFSDTVPKGSVIDQSPKPGSLQPKGTTIGLTISKGKEFTISYDANGGSGAPAALKMPQDGSVTIGSAPSGVKSYAITFNTTGGNTLPGQTVQCSFNNWNSAVNGSGTAYLAGAKYSTNSNATLYAQWNNPAAGTLPTPVWEYHTFTGWFTAASGGKKVEAGTVIAESKTVFAQWTENQPSGWVTSLPSGVTSANADIQEKKQYSFANKVLYDCPSNSPGSEWNLIRSELRWNDYGEWMGFSTTVYTETESRHVEPYTVSTQVVNGYNVFAFCTKNASSGSREYREYSVNGNYAAYGLSSVYAEFANTGWASISEINSAATVSVGGYGNCVGNPQTLSGYNRGNKITYILYANYPDQRLWYLGSETYTTVNTTYYKYQERTSYTQYFYWKWDAYSAWQDDEVAITADRDVKTQKVYNYRMK